MADDNPLPNFYRIEDDGISCWAVADGVEGLLSILAGHEIGFEMEPGDRVVITRLDPADAAQVMINDDDDGPREGPRRKRPLTDYGVGSFFSTEW